MKKLLSVILAVIMTLGCLGALTAFAEEGTAAAGAPKGFTTGSALYAHAVNGSTDGEAWTAWQNPHDSSSASWSTSSTKYFFLPSSAGEGAVDIYNGFSSDVTLNGVSIPAGETKAVNYKAGTSYTVTTGTGSYASTYTVRFMKSNAEAAVYINNSDADGAGTDLMSYLSADKSRKAAATGAIVDANGKIDNTPIKKIKGRGNTTWTNSAKKPFNITYDSKVSIAGMAKGKKYSLLANFQDDSLSRNRFLYDLADAVGTPYASDSRYVDFYCNGYYWGSYQMTEKVEAGSSSLVYDVDEADYLNEDGTVKKDFSFLCEIDASAGADDYYVYTDSGNNITIKAPELEPGDPGYNEVKQYVKEKFDEFFTASKSRTADLSPYADTPSIAKLYLINELGKNWDSGVSSTFFTYKPDSDGSYKFFASPVWDYDNSLGNAVGVSSDLNRMGVPDYTQYTGWWCKYKGKNSGSKTTSNIVNNFANNRVITELAAEIWFEEFVPAINHFAGSTFNVVADKEIYSAEHYYSLIGSSAEMNYTSGWALNTGSWIANHTTLKTASYDYKTKTYAVSASTTSYPNSFKGVFDFCSDWLTSRAAWLSDQMAKNYDFTVKTGDINRDGYVTVQDATEIQRFIAGMKGITLKQAEMADLNNDRYVTISDATYVQMIVAKMIDVDDDPAVNPSTEPATEPSTQPVEPITQPATSAPDGYTSVIFENSLNWSGTIYCYCYNSTTLVNGGEWPGQAMTDIGNNLYQYNVNNNFDYIIFSNNIEQTEKISFDGTATAYRALAETNEKGRHLFETIR